MRTPMPPPFRVRFTETRGALVCEMPPVRTAGALAQSALHLALWGILLVSVVDVAASGAVPGAPATLAGVLVMAGTIRAVLRAAACHLVREHVVLTRDRFEYVQAFAGRVRVRRFARVHVRDVRAERGELFEGPRGGVAFGFGAATVRFGRGLTESEARLVAERLRQALEAPALESVAPAERAETDAAGPAWIVRGADAPQASKLQASKSAAVRTASADCIRALSMRANLFPN